MADSALPGKPESTITPDTCGRWVGCCRRAAFVCGRVERAQSAWLCTPTDNKRMAANVIKSFTDDKALEFREQVRSWLQRELPPNWSEQHVHATEDELWELRRDWGRKMHEAGYAGMSWPARYGGLDGGPVL